MGPDDLTGATPGALTVLLVEDNNAVCEAVREILALRGYRVLTASSADQALHVARCFPGVIHLLLADIVMPGASGVELAGSLRRRRPQLQVLFTSGHPEDTVLRHGVSLGVAAFLAKPYRPAALLDKIAELLGAPPQAH